MAPRYIIRLDDACTKMDVSKWHYMEELLDRYNIKPLVGIIPNCEDAKMEQYQEDIHFWDKAHSWINKGWDIALHGYNHVYSSQEAGINPMWNKSEFAGLDLEVQKNKIKKGLEVLQSKGIFPDYFFAPSHTFDHNTLEAIKTESSIRAISDTLALKPYRYQDFFFIPQQSGHCFAFPFGVWTFCYHPNTMSEEEFNRLEGFIKKHRNKFCSISELDLKKISGRSFVDKVINRIYFRYRSIRKLK